MKIKSTNWYYVNWFHVVKSMSDLKITERFVRFIIKWTLFEWEIVWISINWIYKIKCVDVKQKEVILYKEIHYSNLFYQIL